MFSSDKAYSDEGHPCRRPEVQDCLIVQVSGNCLSLELKIIWS